MINKTIFIDIAIDNTNEDFKRMITRRKGIPRDQQRLIFWQTIGSLQHLNIIKHFHIKNS
jgi:hypothetical protein